MRKPNYYKQVIKILDDLHKTYPAYNVGRHLSIALADYGDIWNIPDKEMVFALEKYKTELELDMLKVAPEDYVDRVVKDGLSLFDNKDEDEDEDWEN